MFELYLYIIMISIKLSKFFDSPFDSMREKLQKKKAKTTDKKEKNDNKSIKLRKTVQKYCFKNEFSRHICKSAFYIFVGFLFKQKQKKHEERKKFK